MCPGSRKKRSRASHAGFSGSYSKNSEYSTFTKSAPPIAPPGCPLFAFSTIAADRIRILSAARFIRSVVCIIVVICFLCFKFSINYSFSSFSRNSRFSIFIFGFFLEEASDVVTDSPVGVVSVAEARHIAGQHSALFRFPSKEHLKSQIPSHL